MIKSKLSLCGGSVALRQLNPIHKSSIKRGRKVIFKSKSFKLNMTDWPCHALLQKKIVYPPTRQTWGCVTSFYAPIWVMWFCVFYHQTIIFTGKMVFISNGQGMLWSQKVCWKCIFLRSGDPNLLTWEAVEKTQSLGKNGFRQKCLDKSLIYIYIYILYIYIIYILCIYYIYILYIYILYIIYYIYIIYIYIIYI